MRLVARAGRAVLYLVTTVLLAAVVLVALPVVAVLTGLVGLPLAELPVGALERRRLRLLGRARPVDPHRSPRRPGLGAWLRTRYGEAATWREFAYALLLALVLGPASAAVLGGVAGAAVSIVSVPLNYGGGAYWFASAGFLALLGVALAVAVAVAAGSATLAKGLVGGLAGEERIQAARLVDAFEVERRRIERDLHDGAQQRLVGLTMTLGLAQMRLADGRAKELVVQAADQARLALAELRDLVRGIHPQVLVDHGLSAAVDELADRFPVPVVVSMALPNRPPSNVESAAYFVIAEALTNVAKHARAKTAEVSGAIVDDTLLVSVTDDGQGGADPDRGAGLAGLADRVDALGGSLTLSSPLGGPTVLKLELPCSA